MVVSPGCLSDLIGRGGGEERDEEGRRVGGRERKESHDLLTKSRVTYLPVCKFKGSAFVTFLLDSSPQTWSP